MRADLLPCVVTGLITLLLQLVALRLFPDVPSRWWALLPCTVFLVTFWFAQLDARADWGFKDGHIKEVWRDGWLDSARRNCAVAYFTGLMTALTLTFSAPVYAFIMAGVLAAALVARRRTENVLAVCAIVGFLVGGLVLVGGVAYLQGDFAVACRGDACIPYAQEG